MRDMKKYGEDYQDNYSFESILVSYRHKLLLERLKIYKPKYILEIGCGSELLCENYIKENNVDNWLIIEPVENFTNQVILKKIKNTNTINGLFEDRVDDIIKIIPNVDFVICSSLLHEVQNAKFLLEQIKKVMSPSTILHINVPNANSFHRCLAKSMAILESTTTLSDRNKLLQQNCVYDINSLSDLLKNVGFETVNYGGYFVKPFTHAQMENISNVLDQSVLDGLYFLGKNNPDWASEIYNEVVLGDC